MTNWSQLSHAYGSAEDIPVRLDQIEAKPTNELWHDLWSALCHQGSVYSASFAALPRLSSIADAEDAKQRTHALLLAGAIVAGADQSHDAVRETYAADIETLLQKAKRQLSVVTDRGEYVYVLQSILAFEGHAVDNDPLEGIADGEYQVECPGCEEMLFIAIGGDTNFATADDYAIEDEITKTSLSPADPGSLDGLGRRLYDTVLADGQDQIALALTYLYGDATCPSCETRFSVVGEVGL